MVVVLEAATNCQAEWTSWGKWQTSVGAASRLSGIFFFSLVHGVTNLKKRKNMGVFLCFGLVFLWFVFSVLF